MAKTKTKTPAQPIDSVTVKYHLHDLPTAQHKAGLAGLLLQIDSMEERAKHDPAMKETPLVRVVSRGPYEAEFEFTADSMQALMDDLYAAKLEEAKVKAKWAGAELKRIDEVDVKDEKGKTKTEKRFVYDVVKPAGPFLARHLDGKLLIWHKLWQEMLWAIPRGKPTTRGPYNSRAEGEPTKEGGEVWADLVAFEKSVRKTGEPKTVGVGGSILLGAQAMNAEAVDFVDRADHALLLHFWQLTVRVFVPERISADGKNEFAGYVLAIPEVADLKQFNRVYVRGLSELDDKPRGYRPAGAVISLPDQGSLEFMRQLMTVSERLAEDVMPSRYLSGIEFFHMVKLGNNVKVAGTGHVPPRDSLLRQYQDLHKTFRNPLLLAGLLKALLGNRPWFADLADELVEREWSWFVHSQKEGHRTPLAMINFAYEVHTQFKLIQERNRNVMSNQDPNAPPNHAAVDLIVKRVIETYVMRKARTRLGVKEDAPLKGEATHFRVPAKDGKPEYWQEKQEYKAERQHVATDLMLRLRSRHGEDFVDQFSQAISVVAHYLPDEDYALLAAALMRVFTEQTDTDRPRTRDDIKTLTLLALSAASRSLTTRNNDSADTEAGTAGEESAS